jgi:hypothetical protein
MIPPVAKWVCACGTTMQSSGAMPNPTEYLLVSDQDFEAFTGLVQAEDVYAATSHAFRCPTCDRLHVFWRGLAEDPTIYAPEVQTSG